MPKKLILASASPRRKQLLEQVGLIFDIIPSDIDEEIFIHHDPLINIQAIALNKALNVAMKIHKGLIIAADTQVIVDNKVLGKPIDKTDAIRMLSDLSGKKHKVITGVAIIDADTGMRESWVETTFVVFRKLTLDEILSYIESGEYEGKAGAYGIQGRAAAFVERIEGCYFNVVGLPLAKLMENLRRFCK
ncbi:TPA: septum formation protein Maf [bacterium]|nr:septum formation protein Maf [bacterium]